MEKQTSSQPESLRSGVGRSPHDIDGSRPAELVTEFHNVYSMPDRIRDGQPSTLDYDRLGMRMGLIAEEVSELFAAVYGKDAGQMVSEVAASVPDSGERDIVETADALADLIYVIYGMALESGIDLDEVLAEVHSSNLSKLMPDGSVKRREDGKVLKGPDFRRPDISSIIAARDSRLEPPVSSEQGRDDSVRQNPLMEPSALPFEVPDFAGIEISDLEPAILAGIERELEDWDRIATNPEAADIENTVEAVDRAGELITRASAVFWTLYSSVGGDELNKLYERLAPTFASHGDDFYTNKRLYERFKEVSRTKNLDPETKWLVHEIIKDFERRGVNLSKHAKQELRSLNQEIASLEAQIDGRISRQLVETGTTGADISELDGLSQAEIDAAQADGRRGDSEWFLSVENYSLPPKISELKSPAIRARVLADSLNRGTKGESPTDTRDLIVQLTDLRGRRAKLLGFPSHAAIVVDQETVPSAEAARELLKDVGDAAIKALNVEAVGYAEQAKADGVELSVSDWKHYEDRARKDALGVDSAELRDYFELNRVVNDGIFFAANRLYGLTFDPRPDIVGWTPETVSWEVKDEDGQTIGLFMADYYNRPGKSGGAWMSEIWVGSERSGRLPVITNDSNFKKPADGQPMLLTWDEVETVFHEFGHALHGLLSRTHYDRTAGTNVPRDFVELPSQLNEMWAFHPEVLANYSKHWKTGESLPAETREALAQSKFFGQSYGTLEYVQSALIDQAWHDSPDLLPSDPDQVDDFEKQTLDSYGVAHPLAVPRYRTPYFSHAFAGGYDAAYYSYMWSEAMVGELEEWFRGEAAQQDGGFNRDAGEILRRELLSRGNSRDPLESFVAVRGHKPDGAAVVRRRGLVLLSGQ